VTEICTPKTHPFFQLLVYLKSVLDLSIIKVYTILKCLVYDSEVKFYEN
jgi:hypothetical protein